MVAKFKATKITRVVSGGMGSGRQVVTLDYIDPTTNPPTLLQVGAEFNDEDVDTSAKLQTELDVLVLDQSGADTVNWTL